MKLEYLATGAEQCPLVRLYAFTLAEARQFVDVLRLMATGSPRIAVHELPWVEPIGMCRLFFRAEQWDQAMLRTGEPAEFECGFTVGRWENLHGLVEPFAAQCSGFQWLAGVPGEAALLLSVDGRW